MADSASSAVPVSLRPDSFTSEQPVLTDWSLESVVAHYKDAERKRSLKTEPESDAEVLWRAHTVPRELFSVLRSVARRLGVSRSVLTKCMSRHMVDWYSDGLGLDLLASSFNEVYDQIRSKAAYATLRIQAENPALFSFVGPTVGSSNSYSSIRWVVERLSEIREVVGGRINDLVMVGFMWSLCQLDDGSTDADVISTFFKPEVANFTLLVKDRHVDVRALREKYQLREGFGGFQI